MRTVSNLVQFFQMRGYEPGERLPSERDLASRFNVARGVLREALKSLESMRYLERKPNSGIFLLGENQAETSIEALVLFSDLGIPLGREMDLQCLEVRKMLEEQAVRTACERRTSDNLAALHANIAASDAALKDGAALSQMDYEFHMLIFECTGNRVLVRLVTPFYLMSRVRREEFFSKPENFQGSLAHHREILQAIEAKDAARAAALMDTHIGRVEQYFAQDVPEQTPA